MDSSALRGATAAAAPSRASCRLECSAAQFGAIFAQPPALYPRYVGDSATDLTALLAADVGILVGTSESARRIARRFGVKLAPLPAELPELPAADADGGGSGGGAVIYEAASWEQIRSALGFGGGAAAV